METLPDQTLSIEILTGVPLRMREGRIIVGKRELNLVHFKCIYQKNKCLSEDGFSQIPVYF